MLHAVLTFRLEPKSLEARAVLGSLVKSASIATGIDSYGAKERVASNGKALSLRC
jgi:hypothetical protein